VGLMLFWSIRIFVLETLMNHEISLITYVNSYSLPSFIPNYAPPMGEIYHFFTMTIILVLVLILLTILLDSPT